ncbi:MAG: outer membrane beta-barrel protein [Endomicrobiaceae bacterium]|nr:outer membrane beta-barrel protein [Endomicrobiaceae bacterium]
MKKGIITLVLLFCVSVAYSFEIVPKIGLDLDGTFISDYEVKPCAISAGVEGRYQINDYFSVLAGVEYLPERSIKTLVGTSTSTVYYYSDKKFSVIPAYIGIMAYPLGNYGEYKPYLKLDIGYNLGFTIDNAINSSTGMYYAFGFGFELYEKYIAEISSAYCFATDNGKDVSYKKIGLRLGYKFTI